MPFLWSGNQKQLLTNLKMNRKKPSPTNHKQSPDSAGDFLERPETVLLSFPLHREGITVRLPESGRVGFQKADWCRYDGGSMSSPSTVPVFLCEHGVRHRDDPPARKSPVLSVAAWQQDVAVWICGPQRGGAGGGKSRAGMVGGYGRDAAGFHLY